VLVPVIGRSKNGGGRQRAAHEQVEESKGLAEAIDLDVVAAQIVALQQARPATLIGSGKVEEIAAQVHDSNIGLVVIDHAVSPIQQRNLENAFQTKVLDRTGLILEIFGRRARTREGRLQVELAHLTYQRGRLVRSWTHLERQRGGFGFLGGPGETQIETDRRLIQERITKIRSDLEGVVRTRELHRKGRARVPYPVVALVGYTNAGKSTLFNRLTGAGVMAKDQVFATLDPTMREIVLPSGRRIILSDTVGFISNLPTMLVAAFRATLEEVVSADLILHVRDIAHAETEAQKADVNGVLRDLGRDQDQAEEEAKLIEVFNKIDLVESDRLSVLRQMASRMSPEPVLISSVTGEGTDSLLRRVDDILARGSVDLQLEIEPVGGAILHWLHEHGDIISQATGETGVVQVHVRLPAERVGQLKAKLSGDAGATLKS